MVDHRQVKKPASLKATVVSDDDQQVFAAGVDAAIGTDLAADAGAAQLDIRYFGGKTFVSPVRGPAALKPWVFSGYVSPLDCRAHYLSTL